MSPLPHPPLPHHVTFAAPFQMQQSGVHFRNTFVGQCVGELHEAGPVVACHTDSARHGAAKAGLRRTTGMEPFYKQVDFWINVVVGVAGLVFSILAYAEAKQAKRAAVEAGRTVKLQTITIELTEISQKLDRILPEIRFSQARDLLAEISRRVRRAISPYANDDEFRETIVAVRDALIAAQDSLRSVRPTDPEKEDEAPNAVYYGVENELANVNNCIADLLGLFEMKSVGSGESNAEA
jgi:hypothetical protein